MLDLKASPYIVTCRGHKQGSLRYEKEGTLWSQGGRIIKSLFGIYGCNIKEKKERADVLFS